MVASTLTQPAVATPTPEQLREQTERTLIEMLEQTCFYFSERQQADALLDLRLRSIEAKLGIEFNGVPSNS